jgi:CarboxypepD_reg-like domain
MRLYAGVFAVATLMAGNAQAQSISGVLVSATDSQPVAYGTVILGDSGRGRFADATGRFFLGSVPRGTYRIRARQIGFSPADTTVAVGDSAVRVILRLRRSAFKLATIPITARRSDKCVATGIPDSAINPQLAGVFDQLRDNVDRYRILVDEYPFHYRREEHRFVRTEDSGDSTASFDTVSYYSRDLRRYRVGDVLYHDVSARGEQLQYMYLPTFADLADTAFQDAHCFSFAGQDHGTIRIDFQPASRIGVPDIDGSIYLDARRYIVRRAVFRLTKPDAVVPPILGLTVTTTFDEIVPLVPVIGSTHSEQRLPSVQSMVVSAPSGLGSSSTTGSFESTTRTLTREVIEDDRLLDHSFADDALALTPRPSPTPPAPPPVVAASECKLPPAIDSADVLVYGILDGGQRADAHADSVLRGIQQMFHLPAGASFPVFGYAFNDGSAVAPTPSGQVTFSLGKGGRLTRITLTATSLSAVVDSSLLAALRRADSARAFGNSSAGDFTLSLSSATPPQTARAAVLARIAVPVWHLAQRAALDSTATPPMLPAGSGTFEFVVDERGHANPATARAVGPTQGPWATTLVQSLPRFRFRPALIGPCPVKQIVLQPFSVHPPEVVR